MKVAIVHDWLVKAGGAEKVLQDILSLYPKADLYSVINFMPKMKGKTTFIQKLPFAKKLYPFYLPLMPYAIESFDLSSYDLIISSSSSVAKGVIVGPNQVHICYCHSPMRYAWDLKDQYLQKSTVLKKCLAQLLLHKIRQWDVLSSFRVDAFIANSSFIAKRIEKIYRRKSDVIYPGVDTDFFSFFPEKEDYYITASRLVPYKRVDLIVEAFSKMPEKKLFVIGEGPVYKKIAKMKPPNVQMFGFQKSQALLYMMQRAKAFIFAAKEDFGIAPLEALSCGTPVIAYGEGGAKETLMGIGRFFYSQTSEAIVKAVLDFEKITIDPKKCRGHALAFSRKRFLDEFRRFIERKIDESTDISRGQRDSSLALVEEILPQAISQAREGKLVTSQDRL